MSSPYDQLAPYYDLAHAGLTADVPFYLALAREVGGSVLELGCGTGRTMVPLAEAGVEIVGLDNSPAMLDRARRRLEARSLRARLVLGEMTGFELGRLFELAIVPFNTWMHLIDRASQSAALGCIWQHLVPGGKLVIDVPAPATIVDLEHDRALTLEGTFTDPESGEIILQFACTDLDPSQQVLRVTWIYDRVRKDGSVHRTAVPMALRYLYPDETELLLAEAGFEIKQLWGDYDRGGFSDGSERLIVLAEKPGGAAR